MKNKSAVERLAVGALLFKIVVTTELQRILATRKYNAKWKCTASNKTFPK